MKISIILLDWSVRESFHSIYYLNHQSSVRNSYELIWVEYFDRRASELEAYCRTGQLDQYIVLGNPPGDYHKHIAWNKGVLAAKGEVVVLCDSDAIFNSSFIKTVEDFFLQSEDSFLLIDEIRNTNPQFWPFSYPDWEQVLSTPGLANWDFKRQAVMEHERYDLLDKIQFLNYGSCFCIHKKDYIRYGGLDEHDLYYGLMCGPYDLAFRLLNAGFKEFWHPEEFLLHTYHPWMKPGIDRIGPHYRHNALLAIKHYFSRDTMPYVENISINQLRKTMFAQVSRHSPQNPVFSVVIYRCGGKTGKILFDSVERATRKKFEVLFVGETNDSINASECKFVYFSGAEDDAIVEGCGKARGKIIIIVPEATIFRENALDSLLNKADHLDYPACFLNLLETCTDGFLWTLAEMKPDSLMKRRGIAFERSLLNNLTSATLLTNLRLIIQQAVTLKSSSNADIHGDVWLKKKNLLDNLKMQMILECMLNRIYEYFHGPDGTRLENVEDVFNQIQSIESMNQGSYMEYCFLQRYSLYDYYEFIGICRNKGLRDIARRGYEILRIGGRMLIEKMANGDLSAADSKYWIEKSLLDNIKEYAGLADFFLGKYALEDRDYISAEHFFQYCLEVFPGHQDAKTLLTELVNK